MKHVPQLLHLALIAKSQINDIKRLNKQPKVVAGAPHAMFIATPLPHATTMQEYVMAWLRASFGRCASLRAGQWLCFILATYGSEGRGCGK